MFHMISSENVITVPKRSQFRETSLLVTTTQPVHIKVVLEERGQNLGRIQFRKWSRSLSSLPSGKHLDLQGQNQSHGSMDPKHDLWSLKVSKPSLPLLCWEPGIVSPLGIIDYLVPDAAGAHRDGQKRHGSARTRSPTMGKYTMGRGLQGLQKYLYLCSQESQHFTLPQRELRQHYAEKHQNQHKGHHTSWWASTQGTSPLSFLLSDWAMRGGKGRMCEDGPFPLPPTQAARSAELSTACSRKWWRRGWKRII